MLDDLLFIVVLDDAGLDKVVKFGEDKGFFHFRGQSLGRELCQRYVYSLCSWRWDRDPAPGGVPRYL